MYLSRLVRIEIRKREEKVWARCFSNLRSAVQKGRGKELIFFFIVLHSICTFVSSHPIAYRDLKLLLQRKQSKLPRGRKVKPLQSSTAH